MNCHCDKQFDCPNAVSEETAKECDPKGEINDALNKKKLKAMKLVDTRTGFGFLDGQATVSQMGEHDKNDFLKCIFLFYSAYIRPPDFFSIQV